MPQPNEYSPSSLDKFVQNLPVSAFKNLIANPIMGAAVIPQLAYESSPIGQVNYLKSVLESLAKKELPQKPPMLDLLKDVVMDYYDTYKEPRKVLTEDPFRPVTDLASLAVPFLKTQKAASFGSKFRNYIINKSGRIPSNVPIELMTDAAGNWIGPSQTEILRESLRRNLPLNWIQTVEPEANAGMIKRWLSPAASSVYDPLLEQRNRAQIGATREMAQGMLDPTGRLKIANEPGVNIGRIQKDVSGVGGQSDKLWGQIQKTREDIFGRAKKEVVPFSWEETVKAEDGTISRVKRSVDIEAPIFLNETYPVLESMRDKLGMVQDSLIKNGLALSDYSSVLSKLNGILKNPAYKTLQGKFNIADLETIYRTRQGINKLRNYVKKQLSESGLATDLQRLNDAMATDISDTFHNKQGLGLYSKEPTLGTEFDNYLKMSREELKKTHTAAYKSLGKGTWEGTNPQEIMNDPAKAIPRMMGSYDEFEKGTKFLGTNTSRQVLLTDLFENALDVNRGYDFGKISDYLKIHRNKINLVMNTDQKHALGVWAGIVQNQNKLNDLQKMQNAMGFKKDQGVVNIVSGVAAQRPGLLALGAVREGQLLIGRKWLAQIASDTDAAYAAARLTQTPISHPSMMTRTKNFLKAIGKMNIVGQLNKADGSTENVTITPDGEILSTEEVAKPEWW